jgi:4-hydroxy-3-methylbut-2-enyl diphosphate reductase IspH
VTAGASTPQWIIDDLVARIREIWRGEEVGVAYYK